MKSQTTEVSYGVLPQVFRATLLFLALLGVSALGAQPSGDAEEGGTIRFKRISNRVVNSESEETIRRTINGVQTFIRVRGETANTRSITPLRSEYAPRLQAPADTICNLSGLAIHGEKAPGTSGGTLDPLAFFNPTTINSLGSIAFNSLVDGSTRNQGVFIADSAGKLTPIAIGCGGYGGGGDTTSSCGDPTPVGGHFGGFFLGTDFTPDINDGGDVLFFCDVNGGSSRRGLFLYQAASGTIVKVAVVGDASPLGGTFATVGPGTLNNGRKVVFPASSDSGGFNTSLFMWDNGVITKVAALGDPAPGGGTFSILGGGILGFVDGTSVPVNPLPAINDVDQVAFRAIVSGGITERGIIIRTAGVNEWSVKVPDPTPIGGTYADMQAPSLNNAGQIAFLADYHPSPTTTNTGWFAGAPGNWRKVIVFFDPIDNGQCLGLAFSNNPMQTIDDQGNVTFWTNLDSNGTEDRIVLSLSDGTLLIAARRDDPTPIGGTFGSMDAWPAITGTTGTINAATPGAQHGAVSAHMTYARCGTLELMSASSKLGQFEIDLPLTGASGVECRSGGPSRSYSVIFTFNNAVTSADDAATSCGSVSSFAVDPTDAHRLIVSLIGVTCNQEYVTVSLTGIHDEEGNTLASAAASMGLLLGDTTGDGLVDRSDVQQTKVDRGQPADETNFREDVNVSGAIDAPDVRLVKSKVGTSLPSQP